MQSRFLKTLLLAAVIVGGIWILVNRDQIRKPGDVLALLKETFLDAPEQTGMPGYNVGNAIDNSGGMDNVGNSNSGVLFPSGFSQHANPLPPNANQAVATRVVRVASFKLNPSVSTVQGDATLNLLADICRRYDAIALQKLDSQDEGWLAKLTQRMNQMGATGTGSSAEGMPSNQPSNFFFVSDRNHNQGRPTQSAIIYNRRTLELDQSKWYSVNDPDNLLGRKPIVAWFRARGPRPEQSLTFTLVNVEMNNALPAEELIHLNQLFRAIRNDGRGEDDVLIVGDFNAGNTGLQAIQKMNALTWVVSKVPNMQNQPTEFDNLVFNETATVEFTGRGGVFDFMRYYNLGLDDSMRISAHMPVWAEFSIFEGMSAKIPMVQGTLGRVADSKPEESDGSLK